MVTVIGNSTWLCSISIAIIRLSIQAMRNLCVVVCDIFLHCMGLGLVLLYLLYYTYCTTILLYLLYSYYYVLCTRGGG